MPSATLLGIETVPVDVQADVGHGLPCFHIVGMADAAVLEARQRVRSAIRACGFKFPNAHLVVNLAPAPLRKHGTGFDLPIAVAILVATGQIPSGQVEDVVFVGELSLTGDVCPMAGLLAHARGAAARDVSLAGPAEVAEYVGIVPGARVRGLRTLCDLASPISPNEHAPAPTHQATQIDAPDLGDVVGLKLAKRVLMIAAAGGHNLLMVGPPGSGKSMLAQRLPSLLPPLAPAERLQTALVHDVAGIDAESALSGRRPFRSPHHSCSIAGMVGGGSPARPGEASMAHNGVLYLDEIPQFGPAVLQSLRQPMEDGYITIVRAEGRFKFPARFALIASANPCPCGFMGDPERKCSCDPGRVARYAGRIGGPLLDRIDLAVRVDRTDPALMIEVSDRQGSRHAAAAIASARDTALGRTGTANSALSGADLLEACSLGAKARRALTSSARRTSASGRGVTRVLRVARTIADLDKADRVEVDHVEEAFGYRVHEGTGGLAT